MTFESAEMIVKCLKAVKKDPKNKNAKSYLSAFTKAEIEEAVAWVERLTGKTNDEE